MSYEEIINSRFSEPAALLLYKDGAARGLELNERFIPELWMNVSKEDYIAAFPQKTFDTDNRKRFFDALQKCADTGEPQEVETWRLIFSNCCGYEKMCLKSRLVLVERTEEGAVIYEGVRNISNEKRTQESLEDIEYRYKSASEQINIYNWEYDIATKEMRPCYRCMRDLGLPAVVENYPEPAIDMGIFPPDYADMYRDMMRKIDAGVGSLEADIPLTVGRVPFRVKYTTEFDENGKPVKAFGSATLISETELGHIKLDNQIISALAEQYRGIYMADFISDTIKVIKADDILSVSEEMGCAALIRLAAEALSEVEGERLDLISAVTPIREELFRDSDFREFVYKDEANNRWIRLEYHVIERGGNRVDRLMLTVSVVDDLRAQKMDADRMIAVQKAELEDRQKMLLSAIDAANQANKAKTEFFSSISHDIRTPMNAITGFAHQALEELQDPEHLKEYLDKIISAGDHLMNLINDILDMSRIESGKMEISPQPVKLQELLQSCADMVQGKMDENGVRFFVNIAETGEDLVLCDKLRFNQIILNLLSNAYKFTPSGGGVFLDAVLKEKGEKYRYEIRVKDTGIGMSEEFSAHIFEAYSREKTEAVHRTQGTGLGMSIVRNLVNMMHGTIELVTSPGRGSEFIILLPLDPAKEGDIASPRTTPAVPKRDYADVTVLVVDDTPLNLRLAEIVLKTFGFQVVLSESGVDALQRVKASAPGDIDIILMDVVMPAMDGLETTRRIRALADPALAGIPIIAMTANAFESDLRKTREAGMADHIPKPYTKEELITVIDRNL